MAGIGLNGLKIASMGWSRLEYARMGLKGHVIEWPGTGLNWVGLGWNLLTWAILYMLGYAKIGWNGLEWTVMC